MLLKHCMKAAAYAAGVSIVALPGTSVAQDDAAARAGLEEITVTARRREESLQDVPVAISAYGEFELEQRGIDELGQLNAVAPNVSLYGGMATADSQGSFRMRGIPGVATYVDGVWQSTTDGMFTLGVVEVDRIEVLRGPQGTLFGKNAVGGAIQYVTRLPGDEFGARMSLTTGSYDRRDSTLAVDLPLSDTVKTKFTAASLYREGFVDSLMVNRSWGDINDEMYRADLLWEPSENFTARFIAERSKVDRWGPARVLLELGEPVYDPVTGTNSNPRAQAYANIGMPLSNRTHAAGYPGGEVGKYQNKSTWEGRGLRVDLDRYTLDLNWYFSDTMQLRSITGFREHWRTAQTDFDATETWFIERDFRGAGKQITQELQLIGEHDRFSWVGGVFFWDDISDGRTWTWVAPEFRDPAVRAQAIAGGMGVTAQNVAVPPGTLDSMTRTETDGWAVFADGTVTLTDKLTLSLGIREQDEDLKAGALVPVIAAPELPGSDPAGDEFENRGWDYFFTDSFDSFTWRAALQYQFTPDIMGYIGYSEGFSAGGISIPNLPYPDIPTNIPYKPETLENFEIGLRADWADGLIRTNVTAFKGDYDNIQITNYLYTSCDEQLNCGGPLRQLPNLHTVNAAKAEVKGIELESIFLPGDNWRVTFNVGRLDAEYTEVGAAAIGAVDVGSPFAQAPDWTVSTSVQYTATLRSGAILTPRLDYTWTDEYTLATDTRNQNFQEPYGLLNFRLTYEAPDGRWQAALFGTNLTDEYYMTSGFYSESNLLNFVSLGRPREVGASISFNFE